jgi:hypothetical protein
MTMPGSLPGVKGEKRTDSGVTEPTKKTLTNLPPFGTLGIQSLLYTFIMAVLLAAPAHLSS